MSSHATSHVISMQEARRPRDQRFTMRTPVMRVACAPQVRQAKPVGECPSQSVHRVIEHSLSRYFG